MAKNELDPNLETPPIKEELINAIVVGLKTTYNLHEELGDAGRSNLQQNPFGDITLTMDLQAEDAVLAALKTTSIPLQVFSEEHGNFQTGENPEYTVALDGLDGSAEYKEKRGISMYGTMAGILNGLNPTYEDYIICGIMIHSPSPQLLVAIKDQGCFSINIQTGERIPLPKLQPKEFSNRLKIDLDTNWPPYKKLYKINLNVFPNMGCSFFSAAAQCALFINGEIDLALQWTRKGNLEQAVIYGFTKENKGAMITTKGNDLGDEYFITFGQDSHIPLIISPTKTLALDISLRFALDEFS